jgi:hypothetical protein
MQAPQLNLPPTIFKFEEVEAKEPGEENETVMSEAEEEPVLVPAFMTTSNNMQLTMKHMLDDVFTDHRCYSCSRYLCCGGTIFHDVNCWYFELCYEISLDKLRQIQTYRIDVYKGVMKDWEEYAFEPFNQDKHIKQHWGAQHFGFYVRCFTCTYCQAEDFSRCHVNYHHHA